MIYKRPLIAADVKKYMLCDSESDFGKEYSLEGVASFESLVKMKDTIETFRCGNRSLVRCMTEHIPELVAMFVQEENIDLRNRAFEIMRWGPHSMELAISKSEEFAAAAVSVICDECRDYEVMRVAVLWESCVESCNCIVLPHLIGKVIKFVELSSVFSLFERLLESCDISELCVHGVVEQIASAAAEYPLCCAVLKYAPSDLLKTPRVIKILTELQCPHRWNVLCVSLCVKTAEVLRYEVISAVSAIDDMKDVSQIHALKFMGKMFTFLPDAAESIEVERLARQLGFIYMECANSSIVLKEINAFVVLCAHIRVTRTDILRELIPVYYKNMCTDAVDASVTSRACSIDGVLMIIELAGRDTQLREELMRFSTWSEMSSVAKRYKKEIQEPLSGADLPNFCKFPKCRMLKI